MREEPGRAEEIEGEVGGMSGSEGDMDGNEGKRYVGSEE